MYDLHVIKESFKSNSIFNLIKRMIYLVKINILVTVDITFYYVRAVNTFIYRASLIPCIESAIVPFMKLYVCYDIIYMLTCSKDRICQLGHPLKIKLTYLTSLNLLIYSLYLFAK